MKSRTDDELLRASAHDAQAFGVFYRRHVESVLAYLRRRTGDMETAADLTADVFASAYASRRRFKPRREPARAWLFGIANKRLAMARRKRLRAAAAHDRLGVQRVGFLDEELERAEAALSPRLRGDVLALVADLPAEQREAVLARVVDERGYDETVPRRPGTIRAPCSGWPPTAACCAGCAELRAPAPFRRLR